MSQGTEPSSAKGTTRRFGRYETLQEIAKGGMATVYLGRALGEGGFERLVAIKLMHEQFADNPEFEAMFLDEARLAARIRHPNVVPTLDVQKSPDGMFIVMEYVEGPPLAAILRELRHAEQPPPTDVVCRIFVDLLNGLHEAHELTDRAGTPLHLVHRDISPHNILIGGDGITRITDFGVARAAVRMASTSSGEIKGKLAYMAPEQLVGEKVDLRSDLYAAGITLWETLAGKRLFRADEPGMLISLVLAGASESPRQVNPTVPVPLDEVCMQALRPNPEDRYESAAEFCEALEQAAQLAKVKIASARLVSKFVKGLDCFAHALVPRDLLLQEPTPISTRSFATGETNTSGEAVVSVSRRLRPRLGLVGAVVAALAGVGFGLVMSEFEDSNESGVNTVVVTSVVSIEVQATRSEPEATTSTTVATEEPDVGEEEPVSSRTTTTTHVWTTTKTVHHVETTRPVTDAGAAPATTTTTTTYQDPWDYHPDAF